MRLAKWSAGAALALLVAACGSPEPSAEPEPWGTEAAHYFGALSEAYSSHDFYGVLDFYAPTAEVEKWRGDFRGGGLVADLLRWNQFDLGQDLLGLHLSEGEALSLVRWPVTGEMGAVVSSIADGVIVRDTVFDLASSLQRGQRQSESVLVTYQSLYEAYAAAWSSGDPEMVERLYTAGATIDDPLQAIHLGGLTAIGAAPMSFALAPGELTDADAGVPVYLGPGEFGRDPQRAVGVYRLTDEAGCEHQVAIRWQLEEGLIAAEQRYHEVESFRRCGAAPLPAGWWTGLSLPIPSDQIVSGVVQTASQAVPVHNGTRRLERLVAWGLERFTAAGLEEPRLDRVTFEPSRGCAGVSGRVDDADGARDLFLCMYESDLCPTGDACPVAALNVRVAVLHELGHAWMLDQLDDATRTRLMELSGRRTWRGENVPWFDRGVEYAAEVLAWGLADEQVTMVRLGSPPCDELRGAFLLLTGISPPADGCPE